jgi:glycosyltransferase involved in cell wall biosynthesis
MPDQPVGNQTPLVSVLTPSFGQARWLEDNLLSVEAQTYTQIEHVVMDGGSTDGSVDILRRHSGDGLLWVSEPDDGQSDAINRAFAASSGEIIGWLNSDDAYFGPTAVEDAVAVFLADPAVVVVYGHALLVNAEGLILQTLWVPPFDRTLLRIHDFIIQPAVFIRRSAVGLRLVDPSYDFTMDYELFLRLSRTYEFRRLDRILAIDRHHAARKSYTMLDTWTADSARLEQRYGIARGSLARFGRKTWKILARVAGAKLVTSALNEPVAFSAVRDGPAALTRRQLITPRSAMEMGDLLADGPGRPTSSP